MPSVTVPGTNGSIITIPTTVGVNNLIAQQIATALQGALNGGTLVAASIAGGGAIPAVPAGSIGEGIIAGTSGGPFALPSGYTYLVDGATAPTTIWGSANQNFMLGSVGGAFFSAATGNTTVQGSGGNTNVDLQAGSTYLVGLGAGNDTIAASGSGTIDGGTGANYINLRGSGAATNNYVVTEGVDTVIAGAGNTTIASYTSGMSVLGGSGSLYDVSAGNSIINAGSGPTTIFGGAGDYVYGNNSSSLVFIAGNGPSTVIGGTTIASIQGGAGSNVTFATANAPGAAGAVIRAGAGNEILSAQFSSSSNTIAGGVGNSTLIGGAGPTTFWVGTGADSLVAGSGADIFQFVKGAAGTGNTDIIHNFKPTDVVGLTGYGGATAITSSVVTGSSTLVTLSDGTKINFDNFANLTGSNFGISG